MSLAKEIPLVVSQDVVRFFAFVPRPKDGCWEWQGSLHHRGYGLFSLSVEGNKTFKAHRISWAISFGAPPVDLEVLHKCDNPKCVRPDHLFLGTQRQNVDDSIGKGRFSKNRARGEKQHSAKLTEREVKQIRELRERGSTLQELGKMFGVAFSNVAAIVNRTTWKHV